MQVGAQRFYLDLFLVGLLYHLYNQFAFNTLQRVSPVSHGVCNVVKRVVIIFSSVLFFNQVRGFDRRAGGLTSERFECLTSVVITCSSVLYFNQLGAGGLECSGAWGWDV